MLKMDYCRWMIVCCCIMEVTIKKVRLLLTLTPYLGAISRYVIELRVLVDI